MARSKTSWPVLRRRISQTVFVLAFVWLFLQTVYQPVNQTGRGVDLFFHFDPLVLLTTWLASHQIAGGLLLSLITLGVTLLAGRWFCGWICPFGALHNLFATLRSSRAKDRIASSTYTPWQKGKYYILVGLLFGCAMGLNLAGWFDPFSFLFRGVATVLYPMFDDATKSSFGWIYQADPGIGRFKVTTVSEPVYEVLRRHVLAAAQPHFYGTLVIALLFFAVLFLNLYRARFWCRYICPLGAMLGVAGKNPLVQITRNEAACNNCRLCVADCQGGASPDVAGGWKPSECFYCFNCQSACPQHAIKFSIHVLADASGEKVPGEKR
jgi:polyferredoxin